jgi:glycosyltransferase involved in cell wall biosynthesis
LNILQVSTADVGGGAEKVAYNLFQQYRERRHNSWLAVGRKHTNEPGVLEISKERAEKRPHRVSGLRRVSALCENPRREIETWLGIEDFNYPATREILNLLPQKPDVLHCHNLHGGYFDLRALPRLTHEVPTILTLHDAWLMSGHCAHSLDCERWKTGCGQCPDLHIYPAIRRDATAYNWRRKRNILRRSRLYVVTPSEWLMRKVGQSILAPSVMDARVVPNGVDLSLFRPGDRQAARSALGIPHSSRMLLFVANGARRNVWKDYDTMRRAAGLVAEREKTQDILFIGLGEEGPAERIENAELRLIPYQQDPSKLVPYYQAADLYLHAARADTFPTTVLEALACGTPVVATAVGGIREQVKGLDMEHHDGSDELNRYGPDQATGTLTPVGDANAMASCTQVLLNDHSLRLRLRDNAVKDARVRFDVSRQIDRYLSLYEQLLRVRKGCSVAASH